MQSYGMRKDERNWRFSVQKKKMHRKLLWCSPNVKNTTEKAENKLISEVRLGSHRLVLN